MNLRKKPGKITGKEARDASRVLREHLDPKHPKHNPAGTTAMGSATVATAWIESHAEEKAAAGKQKRGKYMPIRRAIESAAREAGGGNLDDVLGLFEDYEWVPDRYESLDDRSRIDIHNVEVDRAEQEVRYQDRKGQFRKVSFKRIANILSKYR